MNSKTSKTMAGRGQRARFSLDGEGEFEAYDFGLRWNGWAVPCCTLEQISAALAVVNEGSDYPYLLEERSGNAVIVTTHPNDQPEIYGREYAVLAPSASPTDEGIQALYTLDLGWVFARAEGVGREAVVRRS